jgi:hypothetical protein
MNTFTITVPNNPYIVVILTVAVIITVVRIVRWIADILP